MMDQWILSFMRSLIGFFETEMAGPFSQCHQVVPPQSIFASCVQGQCGTKGDTTALCHSLQAYASLCAQAGQAPAWRNRTFCQASNLVTILLGLLVPVVVVVLAVTRECICRTRRKREKTQSQEGDGLARLVDTGSCSVAQAGVKWCD
ncbi:zonadhesin-like isoform X1 [Aotus nancymaae]|uniref:zonadhesin-like isoform X1 n=1 Tax=Aotus nancymaae TaxID=37293 RepID=UPI0030FE0ADC